MTEHALVPLSTYEKDIRAAQAKAWDQGYKAGTEHGESGYVAGTDRKLKNHTNPYQPPNRQDLLQPAGEVTP